MPLGEESPAAGGAAGAEDGGGERLPGEEEAGDGGPDGA
jgi:hypothetical protein